MSDHALLTDPNPSETPPLFRAKEAPSGAVVFDPALRPFPSSHDLQPLLLKVEDVCALLSLSRSTVNRLLVNGTIPSVAVGRTRRVVKTDLLDFVADLAAGKATVDPRVAGRKPSAR